jgi:hypothetical protein
MIHRKNFNQTRKSLFEFGDLAIIKLIRPILLIFPIRRWMKFVQTSWLHIAITSKTIESLPVFPASFPNEMIWIHTLRPMTKMRNLIHHRPTIIVFVNHNWNRFLMKHFDRNLMSTKTSRTILTFFTIIWMRQNATIFKYKKSFFTYSLKSVSVFGIVGNSLRFNLERPI